MLTYFITICHKGLMLYLFTHNINVRIEMLLQLTKVFMMIKMDSDSIYIVNSRKFWIGKFVL